MAKYKRKTKEEREQELNELTERMTAQIDSYFISQDALKEHLQFMSNFHNYSPRNMALIESQFKGAQAVGSFNFWKSKGVSVKKGERGIQILVPTPIEYFRRGDEWVQKRFANAKEKEQIKNGTLATQKRPFFKVGHVFEYTQTNAREKGFEVSKLFGQFHKDGNIENNKDLMAALKKVADKVGYTILDEPRFELGTAKGAAFPTIKEIALNPRNTDFENVTTLLHELAHAKLHTSKESRTMTVPEREFQAEMVSYVVAHKFGIDTEDFTLSYLGNWTRGGRELKDKEKLLGDVRAASNEFIEIIEEHLKTVDKDKTIELDEKTVNVLDQFYKDNLSFWNKEIERNPELKETAEELALNDVKNAKTDPYSPTGNPLDESTKEQWIMQKTEMLQGNEKDMDAHKFIVRSLENENGIDAEEVAQIILINGVTNKEHSFSVWAGDISNNELEPYYVHMSSPREIPDDYTDLSDAILQDYIISDLIKDPTEIEERIQEYYKDGDKTFSIEINSSSLHGDLHHLIVDAEASDILLKGEKGQLSKQDLIDFGRLVEGDKEFSYNLDHQLHKPIEEMIKQTGVTGEEEKVIQTAIKALNVNLDASDFLQHVKVHENSLLEYEYGSDGAYDELLLIQENNGLTSNRVELDNPQFEAQLAEHNPEDHLKYLSYKAVYQSEILDYTPTAGEPVMMVHNGDKDLSFQPFGEVNNRDFKQDTVAYTVAIPDGNALQVVSGTYNSEEYINPLHHIQKNEKLDKEKCGLLEKSFDEVLTKEENKYLQGIAPRLRQELERL